MDEKYFAKKIEQKWQQKWAESGAFEAELGGEKPKFYQLEMLPYPSGNLHMGHVRNYSAGDALAWYKRLRGFNVLHPIGWDSFGQPAEDAAVKRGVNPRQWTEDNIVTMQGQLRRLGVSYDWRRQMFAIARSTTSGTSGSFSRCTTWTSRTKGYSSELVPARPGGPV